MNVYTNGNDFMVAENIEQAVLAWEAFTGESIQDYDLEAWHIVNPNQVQTIAFEFDPTVSAKIPPGVELVVVDEWTRKATATFRQWAQSNGPGFLCSLDY